MRAGEFPFFWGVSYLYAEPGGVPTEPCRVPAATHRYLSLPVNHRGPRGALHILVKYSSSPAEYPLSLVEYLQVPVNTRGPGRVPAEPENFLHLAPTLLGLGAVLSPLPS